ncbi:RNase H family protein [Boudabousia liubingyangii]|uniref:RNase H family protein n=1 Tax=Boudabousia liubingyangii TaxID=1921764 RepID=UPI0009FA5008|nr:RNase H family protein [Boudabousia liubingyangii]
MTIIAAADGSALSNPGPAGWAWVIDDNCWAAGGWPQGTNNIGELTAVLELLRATKSAGKADEPLHILCDSQYVINSLTKWRFGWKKKGWKKADGKPVLNVEIMKALDEELQGRQVTFEWVKGHAGHDLNEAADDRARAAATAYQQGTTPNKGPGFPGDQRSSQGAAMEDQGAAAVKEQATEAEAAPTAVPENAAVVAGTGTVVAGTGDAPSAGKAEEPKECEICQRIKANQQSTNPYLVAETKSGWVVIADHQYVRGTTMFLSKTHARELWELPAAQQQAYLAEMVQVAKAVGLAFGAEKMNYELLGNGLTHLHWHLFPRRMGDTPRPGPVWWVDPEEFYSDQVKASGANLQELREKLAQGLLDVGLRHNPAADLAQPETLL